MSHYHPPPPGVDGRSNASYYGPPPASSGSSSYRTGPPSYNAPPPPPSRDYDSYAPSRYNDRDRNRGRDRDRDRDRYRDERSDRYQPSRRSENHALPPRPLRSSYRDDHKSESFGPPEGAFTFRSDKPSGVGDSYSSYRPSDSNGPRKLRRGPARGGYERMPRFGSDNFRGRYGGPNQQRRIWKPFKPAERAILQSNIDDQPTEDFADEDNGVVYRAFDQLSDSDEADMDMSDSDNESAEPTAKRARTTDKESGGDSAPKWSNPDPYTALPPTEDSDKKKKDMVQLIRKARVSAAQGPRTSLPADDEDFIRCDTESEEEAEKNDDEEFIDPLTYKRGKDGGQEPPTPASALPPVPLAARVTLPPKPQFLSRFAPTINTAPGSVGSEAISSTASSKNRAAEAIDKAESSALGSRKRMHDDVLKLPAHAKLKPAPKQPVGGKLVSEWQAKPKENPCPWIRAPILNVSINTR